MQNQKFPVTSKKFLPILFLLTLFSRKQTRQIFTFLVILELVQTVRCGEFSEIITLTTSSECPSPQSVSVDRVTGTIYAICNNVDVVKIDGVSGLVTTLITSPPKCLGLSGIYFGKVTSKDEHFGMLYVTCQSGGAIGINPFAPDVKDITILVEPSKCSNLFGMTVNTVLDVVYLGCIGTKSKLIAIREGVALFLDLSLWCANLRSVVMDNIANVIYASCFDVGIIRININAHQATESALLVPFSRCQNAYSIAVGSTGIVYAACSGGEMIRIDTDTKITTLIPTSQCQNPYKIVLNSVLNIIYVVCSDEGIISIQDPIGGKRVITTEVTASRCPNPSDIDIDTNTGIVYIACLGGNLIALEFNSRCPSGYYWSGTQCLHSIQKLQVPTPTLISCDVCSIGSEISTLSSSCFMCENPTSRITPVIILYSFIFVGVLHYLSQEISSPGLPIFFYAVQGCIMIVILAYSNNFLTEWVKALNLVNYGSPNSCLLPLNLYQAIAADIILGLLYFVVLGLMLVMHLSCSYAFPLRSRHGSSIYRKVFEFEGKRYVKTFTAMYLVNFSTILSLIIRYLHCLDTEDGEALYFNSRISCNDTKYKRWFVLAFLILGSTVCLMPPTIGVYLRRKYYGSKNVSLDRSLLEEQFRIEKEYSQIFAVGRRIMVGVYATVLMSRPTSECVYFVFIHLILCVFLKSVKTYKSSDLNDMKEMNLLLFTLINSILTVHPPPSFLKNIISVIMVLHTVPSTFLAMCIEFDSSGTTSK